MSAHRHATVSAWQRDHEGGYAAEIEGARLTVRWTPETDAGERGFRWEAVLPDGTVARSEDAYEEIELAMADAELRAAEPAGAEP